MCEAAILDSGIKYEGLKNSYHVGPLSVSVWRLVRHDRIVASADMCGTAIASSIALRSADKSRCQADNLVLAILMAKHGCATVLRASNQTGNRALSKHLGGFP